MRAVQVFLKFAKTKPRRRNKTGQAFGLRVTRKSGEWPTEEMEVVEPQGERAGASDVTSW